MAKRKYKTNRAGRRSSYETYKYWYLKAGGSPNSVMKEETFDRNFWEAKEVRRQVGGSTAGLAKQMAYKQAASLKSLLKSRLEALESIVATGDYQTYGIQQLKDMEEALKQVKGKSIRGFNQRLLDAWKSTGILHDYYDLVKTIVPDSPEEERTD